MDRHVRRLNPTPTRMLIRLAQTQVRAIQGDVPQSAVPLLLPSNGASLAVRALAAPLAGVEVIQREELGTARAALGSVHGSLLLGEVEQVG